MCIPGQLYVSPEDSGDLLMEITCATTDSDGKRILVCVAPVCDPSDRSWWCNATYIDPFVAKFATETAIVLEQLGKVHVLQPDASSFIEAAAQAGIAQRTAYQWLARKTSDLHARFVQLAGLPIVQCPDCASRHIAGPDDEGMFDCMDCGLFFNN